MCYASGLSLFHLVTEMVFNSSTGLWVQAGPSKCALVMQVCWELNRKKVSPTFWMAGSISRRFHSKFMVLNTDCCKLYSFMETSEAFFWKKLGLGMDWFTLLVVNSERGSDDLVTVKREKAVGGRRWSGEWWHFCWCPFQMGVEHSLSLLWLLPKKVAARFPHNKAHVASYLIIPKLIVPNFL